MWFCLRSIARLTIMNILTTIVRIFIYSVPGSQTNQGVPVLRLFSKIKRFFN